jgi:hypothetical protein
MGPVPVTNSAEIKFEQCIPWERCLNLHASVSFFFFRLSGPLKLNSLQNCTDGSETRLSVDLMANRSKYAVCLQTVSSYSQRPVTSPNEVYRLIPIRSPQLRKTVPRQHRLLKRMPAVQATCQVAAAIVFVWTQRRRYLFLTQY